MKTKLIGILGKAGSGKDTVARMIPDSRQFSFADPMKEFCATVFGWDRETLWGASELRNAPDPKYTRADGIPLTPRHALQTLGTEWGRAMCPDIWPRLGVRRAAESKVPVAVFSDVRFINEARIIREAGGEIWRIHRPGAGLKGEAGTHPSELEQDTAEMLSLVTSFIDNTGTLEDLEAQVLWELRKDGAQWMIAS